LAAGAAAAASAAAAPKVDAAAVDKAFETLKTYDWGADRKALDPIDRALIATHGDAAARKALEKRLLAALAGGMSRSAQDYVCRRLRIVGTAECVKALAALLPDEKTSHIARYALERIGDDTAVQALRDALPKVANKLKPGMIGGLGARRDAKSIAAIARHLGNSDMAIARAAAHALALIGTAAAGKELSAFAGKAPACMKMHAADARLICADQLLADGEKAAAVSLYKQLKGDDQPKHVKVAATKGLLKAMSGK